MKTKSPYIYEGTGSAIDDYQKPKEQLINILQGGRCHNKSNYGLFDYKNPQHKRIMANLRTANIVVKSERWGEVADMTGWFDRFLKSDKSPIKKPLKEMTEKEVSKIIVALDGVVIWKNSI
ncbi:hypothetical protein [Flavobacterium degerlachei]|jgi:hypothetical protein|uniref:Uncharacterized protein n=1 Tax=Flavobacterium degerlachei TaxID=229203 RepID=A0A1H2YZM7_9FLAO|nr:hypothetical protein [Flavobacterium degerlachei]SDX10537.1 hypothetical protein SAMN05444338_10741 [Flavobacterium degerlachei]